MILAANPSKLGPDAHATVSLIGFRIVADPEVMPS